MKKIFSIALVGLSSVALMAQEHRCSTDEYLTSKFASHPELEASYHDTRANIQARILAAGNQKSAVQEGEELVIPVVFHIVYRTNSQNISDTRIFDQIDILNEDYGGTNSDISSVPSDFASFVGSSNIRFELASIDPSGNPTDGIERISTDSTVFSMSDDGIKYTALGGADAWDTDEYLNIWVGRIESGILGYATPPNTALPAEDGVVLGYKYVGNSTGTPYNKGRTAVHEVGHYLGLSHIWGPFGSSCSQDDGISDTPMQFEAHYSSPAHPSQSCGSADMFMNYMDYVEDADMFFFTEGQVTSMESALQNERASLLSSPALTLDELDNEQGLVVFPSPVSGNGTLTVEMPVLNTEANLVLIDILGRVQRQTVLNSETTSYSMDLKGLAEGVYVLQLRSPDNTYSERIVIR